MTTNPPTSISAPRKHPPAFVLPPNSLDRDLVFEFFWKFSVFECALKRFGFYKRDPKKRSEYNAEPDWNRFGAEAAKTFDGVEDSGFQAAVARLVKLQPKKQIIKNGKLAWKPVERKNQGNGSDLEYAITLLKTVRNNLFHGGKFPDGPPQEIARDRGVLRAALAVLDKCYERHPDIRSQVDLVLRALAA